MEKLSENEITVEMKELNDEQLDMVAGGEGGDDKGYCLPPNHGSRISKYAEGYAGRKVYCVNDQDPSQFCWGILQKSYEKRYTIFKTYRVHDILIEDWNHSTDQLVVYDQIFGSLHRNVSAGKELCEIMGDVCTLFLYDN